MSPDHPPTTAGLLAALHAPLGQALEAGAGDNTDDLVKALRAYQLIDARTRSRSVDPDMASTHFTCAALSGPRS